MTTTQSPCGCGSSTASATSVTSNGLERPRYFARQLLTPADMTLEQRYFLEKMRRHNRMLHGWGVVCGAQVSAIKAADGTITPGKVNVSAGYVLAPSGDEMLIDKTYEVDLTTGDQEPADPWSTAVSTPPPSTGGTVYVAVKYVETKTQMVRVQPSGCGCDTNLCEYSRVQDGFTFSVLTALPSSYGSGAPPTTDLNKVVTGNPVTCLACPTDPWVVLASVETGADGAITKIDNCTNRRLVVSFAGVWWSCVPQGVTTFSAEKPATAPAGQK